MDIDMDEDTIKDYVIIGAVILVVVCLGCCVLKKMC